MDLDTEINVKGNIIDGSREITMYDIIGRTTILSSGSIDEKGNLKYPLLEIKLVSIITLWGHISITYQQWRRGAPSMVNQVDHAT